MAKDLVFRPIAKRIELDAVHQLTYVAYLRKGYCRRNDSERLSHYPHLDYIPQTTVFVAVDYRGIVGTLSWTRDGPEGLHVDMDFLEETNKIRAEGRAVASAWRLVVAPHARVTVKVLLGLIHKTVRSMVGAGIQTALFTFNPAHELAYRTILNMKTVAKIDSTIGLISAPAVLMRLDLENVPAKFMKHWV